MAGFIYLIAFAGVFVFPFVFPQLVNGFAYNVYVCALSLIFLFNTGYLYSAWLIHHLNVGLITTEHIVEICQTSLFSRKISELGLDRIQDVSASQKGMSETMFNYGDIDVQTAGELPNFLFTKVPSPNETAQKVMELEEEYAEKHGLRAKIEQNNQENIQNQPEQQKEQGPEIQYPQNPQE
jgi:uncharacterized membrane protein YdbT with pleckstrin-like domain